MLESWKHCVASGGTEAAAARTAVMEKKKNISICTNLLCMVLIHSA